VQERTREALTDFLEFADQAKRLVAGGRQAWDADEVRRLAGEAIVHKIGEAVARVTRDAEFVAAHPQVAWAAMKGMRNVVAHEYNSIDYAIVWNALEKDLPREASFVRAILEDCEDVADQC
jgi:uncharacterized protein with HEPN domain